MSSLYKINDIDQFCAKIAKSDFFNNMTIEEIKSILLCLDTVVREYEKGEIIIGQGQDVSKMCMVIDGSVQIIETDIAGNSHIISNVTTGEVFGEAYAFGYNHKALIDAECITKCVVAFFDVNKIITGCDSLCNHHSRILKNIIAVLANRNYMLTRKIEHVTRKTTRDKLLSFLSDQVVNNESNKFSITYNRQQLADYLSVERSAMSNELSKMQEEGIISYKKNYFEIYKTE